MEFLKVTEDMCGENPENEKGIRELCKFFLMEDEQIEDNIFYFTNGEGFNEKGFTTSLGSETEISLKPEDILIRQGDVFTKLPKPLHSIQQEVIAADRMEKALINILESGVLCAEMEEVCKQGLGFDKGSYL